MWLAMVGRERIEEIIDPELTIERALDTYAQKATRRSGSTSACKPSAPARELTDAWSAHGCKRGRSTPF